MEKQTLWNDIVSQTYINKEMTLREFLYELSCMDLPIFVIQKIYGSRIFTIVTQSFTFDDINDFFGDKLQILSLDTPYAQIYNGHFTIVFKNKGRITTEKVEIQVYDDFIMIYQNIFLTKNIPSSR